MTKSQLIFLDGDLSETAPAFKIVSTTKNRTYLYAGYGLLQFFFGVFIAAVMSSKAVVDPQDSQRTCILYLNGSSPSFGACMWPAVFAAAGSILAAVVAGLDAWATIRLYPPRSRRSVFYEVIIGVAMTVIMFAVGCQIWAGLQSTCNNVKQYGWDCNMALSLVSSDWRLVASAAAFSFLSAILWGFYTYSEYENFRNS